MFSKELKEVYLVASGAEKWHGAWKHLGGLVERRYLLGSINNKFGSLSYKTLTLMLLGLVVGRGAEEHHLRGTGFLFTLLRGDRNSLVVTVNGIT